MTTPFSVMAKPIGPICNLDCTYCYYLEKEGQYAGEKAWRMTDEMLERYIRQFIEAQDAVEIGFAWQGGEPTLLGVGFFRKVVELQRRYANGKRITNALQTNGTLLDDEWGEFLAENAFLLGVSIDGPREIHDRYRVDKQQRSSFDKVVRGIETLQRHRVEFNTLTVVNSANSAHPLAVYRFLKEIGSRYMQFIPVVERLNPTASEGLIHLAAPLAKGEDVRSKVTEWSVGSVAYGEFLVAIFDEWVRNDIGQIFVQMFDIALGQWYQGTAGLCVFAETCGRAMAIEHNGDVYSCDHYVYPEYRIGNIAATPLGDLVDLPAQRAFGQAKRDDLVDDCLSCEVLFACNGDCPKHRFRRSSTGQMGLSYLCPSYKRFFNHVAPYMNAMAALLRQQRPASDLMEALRREETAVARPVQARRAPGRNDSCPCGSGRKYKQCCLGKANANG
jgi:uncharacterized protein